MTYGCKQASNVGSGSGQRQPVQGCIAHVSLGQASLYLLTGVKEIEGNEDGESAREQMRKRESRYGGRRCEATGKQSGNGSGESDYSIDIVSSPSPHTGARLRQRSQRVEVRVKRYLIK